MFENKTEAQAREEILAMVAEYAEKSFLYKLLGPP